IGELDTPVFPSSIDTLPNPLPKGIPVLNAFGIAPGQSANLQEIDGGNPNLKPEIAHTVSFGLVFQSGNAFMASLDHYRIKIDDAITTLPAQTIVDSCAAGDASACALISLPAGAHLPVLVNRVVNAESFVTSGIDGELACQWGMAGGAMAIRVLGNYLL